MPAEPQPPRKRTTFQLDTAFSAVTWPEVSPDDQDAILELLCSLLSPIGKHRKDHGKTSKGKRAAANAKRDGGTNKTEPTPPAPELAGMIDVGLNSITRNLLLSPDRTKSSTASPDGNGDLHGMYTMVFVARGDQQSAFSCQFPKMIGVASANAPLEERTRLIGFSKPSSQRLSKCLHVARLSSVAVRRDAPGAGPLWEFVKQRVKPVDVSWLESNHTALHVPAKIVSKETTIGPKKQTKAQVV